MMARVLGVSRAGYYFWKKRHHTPVAVSSPSGRRLAISARVTELFTTKHKGFAGARTIFADLVAEGIETTLYAVRTIMAQNNLVTKYRRKKVRTTIADPGADLRKDYLRRMFYPPVPTTVLCGDITYLRTREGWMYLATVMDLGTRMVVGWSMADSMHSKLVVDALTMAHDRGFVAGDAIFHSDRGSQYTSKVFADCAEELDVQLSVGSVGVCWDNAVAESFFSTMKLHLLHERKQFDSKQHARLETLSWIETYYNRQRRHSATGLIPAEAMADFLTPSPELLPEALAA